MRVMARSQAALRRPCSHRESPGTMEPMELLELSKSDRRSVEIGVVGPEGGRPVLYFHSPSTSGEELALAEDAATQLGMRLFCVRRPSIKCDRPEEFVSTVAGVTVDAV